MNWPPILDRVVRTPREYFCPIGPEKAREILSCSPADIRDLGHVYGADRTRFDAFDVWNIGLNSGSGRSTPERELRYLGHLLASTDWLDAVEYRLALEAGCPRGPACTSHDWRRPRLVGTSWSDPSYLPGRVRWAATTRRQGMHSRIRLQPILHAWRHTLASYRFHYTHPGLAADTAATRARRVGNCTGLSAVLAEDLNSRGVTARTRCGFLWGGLVGLAHEWVEARDADGRWKPLDPSMAALAATFFSPEYQRFCCGSMLNRLIPVASGHTATVQHWCEGRLLTTYPALRRASGGRLPRPNPMTNPTTNPLMPR
ncbi:transglutaminase-like domain-containing protein [Phytoactinopolyspora halotolerans]|uniref:Transglutaminase domain-containing protein n=1 Tax=Phytoactinopolyspora halotolerans TaxID=1981512 RepID=A0A6L9S5R8_9ACTN|nr:transglutaminase-like domain-containing protein [Phytoactinopolyspora halotolerans]NED99841.1 transglutaminase domain-containing protein [Phytoactinopolyspora halotolerans]